MQCYDNQENKTEKPALFILSVNWIVQARGRGMKENVNQGNSRKKRDNWRSQAVGAANSTLLYPCLSVILVMRYNLWSLDLLVQEVLKQVIYLLWNCKVPLLNWTGLHLLCLFCATKYIKDHACRAICQFHSAHVMPMQHNNQITSLTRQRFGILVGSNRRSRQMGHSTPTQSHP